MLVLELVLALVLEKEQETKQVPIEGFHFERGNSRLVGSLARMKLAVVQQELVKELAMELEMELLELPVAVHLDKALEQGQ